jgi:hypothetical protein
MNYKGQKYQPRSYKPSWVWDQHLDYDTTYQMLITALSTPKVRAKPNPRWSGHGGAQPDQVKRNLYIASCIVCLTNGVNISTAVKALEEYLKVSRQSNSQCVSQDSTYRITLKNNRIIVIPPVLNQIALKPDQHISKSAAVQYARNNFGINTHSLKLAYLSARAKLVAKAEAELLNRNDLMMGGSIINL